MKNKNFNFSNGLYIYTWHLKSANISKKRPLFFSQKKAKKHIGKNKKITDMRKVSKIAVLSPFLGGKNDPSSIVRVEKWTRRLKNLIVKTDTLQIRILELIGLLGEATSDENKCFSKVICIPFSAVQTKIIAYGNAL